MTALIALLTVVLLFSVVFVISAPFRRAVSSERQDPERDDLEAARAAKYREIRDAELDFRTGKLSQEDYEAVDGSLRSEAVGILDRLEPREVADGEEGPKTSDQNPQSDPEVTKANPQVDTEV